MTTANQKGGFIKTLTITRDNDDQSVTILKNNFLKKTENYVVQLTKFITNITPRLTTNDEIMFEILPKGKRDTDVLVASFPDYWRDNWRQFKPKPFYSVMDLAKQIELFFHKFGFIVYNLGFNYVEEDEDNDIEESGIKGKLEENDLGAFPPNDFVYHNFIHEAVPGGGDEASDDSEDEIELGWGSLFGNERIVTFSLLPDGRFSLSLDPAFLSNFYIRVGTQTQKQTGFPEYLYVNEGAELFTGIDGYGFLVDEGDFLYDPDVSDEYTYTSSYAMNAFDERLSLDVVATFPLSNVISVIDGVESHEFILARFPLNDYKKFETDLLTDDRGACSNEVVISEDVNVGLEDLTRKNPNISTIFMLPGTIQQVNLQLWTRYYDSGKIVPKRTDMSSGFWSVKLLFTKKQT